MCEWTSSERHAKSIYCLCGSWGIFKKCNWHHGELKCFPFENALAKNGLIKQAAVKHRGSKRAMPWRVFMYILNSIELYGAQQYTQYKREEYAVNMRVNVMGALSRVWVWQGTDFNHFYFIPRFSLFGRPFFPLFEPILLLLLLFYRLSLIHTQETSKHLHTFRKTHIYGRTIKRENLLIFSRRKIKLYYV